MSGVLSPTVLSAAGHHNEARPQVRMHTSPLSDFYFTLRTDSVKDTASTLPPQMRTAAAQLHALTGFLPDSLPLKTVQNTVLIVHHKNPKYTATIDRLLWRRLDPALGTLNSPEDLSRVLPDISASLQPLCGNKADSIRAALSDLYKSSYPVYLTSSWPVHKRETTAWMRETEKLFLPRERDVLSHLSRQLALPLADSSRVRIWVVGSAVPDDGVLYPSKDRSYVSIVIPARETGFQAVTRVLNWYVQASALLSADSSATALHLLDRALREAKADPVLMGELPRALIDEAITRALVDAYGTTASTGGTRPSRAYDAGLKKSWGAHLAGALTLEEACKSIATAALPPPARK
jgi:hypothetical protein